MPNLDLLRGNRLKMQMLGLSLKDFRVGGFWRSALPVVARTQRVSIAIQSAHTAIVALNDINEIHYWAA